MTETATERSVAIQQVMAATASSDASVQRAALDAMVPVPSQEAANLLWRILVAGLLALTAIALGGLIYTIADGDDTTSPDLIVAAFTSLLTGMIGLFVKSPVGNNGS